MKSCKVFWRFGVKRCFILPPHTLPESLIPINKAEFHGAVEGIENLSIEWQQSTVFLVSILLSVK